MERIVLEVNDELARAWRIVTGDEDLLVLNPFKNTVIMNSRDFLTHF